MGESGEGEDQVTELQDLHLESNGVRRKSFRKFSLQAFEEEEPGEILHLKDVKEQIINAIGTSGKWQLLKCFYIVLIIWMPASFHLLNMVFFRLALEKGLR